jgi:antitoxin (DNA-binding transcriptional repressor) of toxin-antitoxin stability system
MVGILYPGVSRLDYDLAHEGGVFRVHVESNTEVTIARWTESVIHVVPVAQRPPGISLSVSSTSMVRGSAGKARWEETASSRSWPGTRKP